MIFVVVSLWKLLNFSVMEKIELNAGESIKIMVNGMVLELMVTGDNSISVNDHPEQKRLLTIEEIVNEESGNEGCFITDHNVEYYGLSPYGQHFRDAATEAQAHKLIALAEIMRIADYYNEHYADGWEVDWKDVGQKKWFIVKMFSGLHVTDYSTNMFGLPAFATDELAQIALDNNREVFERFFAV